MSRFDWWKTGGTPPRYEDAHPPAEPDPDDEYPYDPRVDADDDDWGDDDEANTPIVTGDDHNAADLPEPTKELP